MRWPKLGHVVATGALIAAASLIADGCAKNESMLFVRSALAVDQSGCIAKPDPSSTMLAFGTLDLAFKNNYWAALLVGNQLSPQGNRDKVRVETSRITLRGAIIGLRTPQQDPDSDPYQSYTVPATGFVDVGTGDTPGYGVMVVEALPSSVGISQSVIVGIRVFGDTLGGEYIESDELTFPVTVCTGCLVDFTHFDPVAGSCAPATEQTQVTAPCILGQDAPIDCRLCAASNSACAQPTAAPAP